MLNLPGLGGITKMGVSMVSQLKSKSERDIRIDYSHHAVDYASSRSTTIVEYWLSVVNPNLVFGLLLPNLAI